VNLWKGGACDAACPRKYGSDERSVMLALSFSQSSDQVGKCDGYVAVRLCGTSAVMHRMQSDVRRATSGIPISPGPGLSAEAVKTKRGSQSVIASRPGRLFELTHGTI